MAELMDTGSKVYSSMDKIRKQLEGDNDPKITNYKNLNLSKVSVLFQNISISNSIFSDTFSTN